MDRSFCLLLIISVLVCMGEAKPRKNQPQPPPEASTMPPEGIAPSEYLCGRGTPKELMTEMAEALEKATEYVLGERNYAWGWTPEPFVDTASAIMSLQLSSGGKWYEKLTEDLTAQLSVKQLEVEFLAHLLGHSMDMNSDRMRPGNRTDMMPDIDVGGMDPDMMPPGDGAPGERPGDMTPPGDGPPGERPGDRGPDGMPGGMRNDSDSMMDARMRMMAIDKFVHHIIALNLTCHPVSKFFGNDLFMILESLLMRMNRPDGDMMPGPDGDMMPGPDGDMMPGPDGGMMPGDRPQGPGGEPGPDGDMMPTCDMMMPGGRMSRPFHYGLGLLAICQSGRKIGPGLIQCLLDAHMDGLFMDAGPEGAPILLLAMACVKDQVPMDHEKQFDIVMTRIANYIMSNQQGDGSFGNPVVTAFALQALKAAETSPMKWNCENAVRNILDSQNEEGAFGDSLGATLAIMPTIGHKTLADLKDVKLECKYPHEGDHGYGMMSTTPRPETP